MTVGARIEINESGIRVPEELSLIGCDNVEFAKACSPKLSIMTQPTRQMAMSAVRLMLDRLNGNDEKPAEMVILSTSYVGGRSVRQINKENKMLSV